RRNQDTENGDRLVQTSGPDAARLDRRHLALVIEPPEGEHDREEEPDRDDDREVTGGGEPDQREHDPLRKLVRRSLRQHARELIRQQNDEQDEGHRETGDRDLAKDIPIEYPQKDAFAASGPPLRQRVRPARFG